MSDKDAVNVRILAADIDYRRLLLSFGLSACATLALIYIQRKMSGPDSFLVLKMRGLVIMQNCADSQVKAWSRLSAWAGKEYLSSRP